MSEFWQSQDKSIHAVLAERLRRLCPPEPMISSNIIHRKHQNAKKALCLRHSANGLVNKPEAKIPQIMSTPEPTWRELLFVDEETPPTEAVTYDGEEIDLDDLSALDEPVHSVTSLVAEMRAGADSTRFDSKLSALPGYETGHLVLRIHTCPDALMLWEIHKELDRRGLAPALRWPTNHDNLQMKFVTILADIYWVAVHYSDHQPLFKGWRALFKLTPGSDAWLDKAYWLVMNMKGSNLSRQGTKALALDDHQRQELMMFPTAKMAIARRELSASRFQEIRESLLSDAMANKDKSGKRKPDDVANRRAQILRVSILSGDSATVISRNWELLMGEPLPRRMVSRHLSAARSALKSWEES